MPDGSGPEHIGHTSDNERAMSVLVMTCAMEYRVWQKQYRIFLWHTICVESAQLTERIVCMYDLSFSMYWGMA